MIRIFMCLGLLLSSNILIANTAPQAGINLTPCFNMNDVERIGKQVNELLRHEFCEEKIAPKKFASVSQNILSKIMTESFLGVTPPENWQQLTDDIIKSCLENKDLCKREARKEFETCIKPKIPLILVQVGPWLAEHCAQLNKSLIQQWPDKKEILKKTINENKTSESAL
ncbi:TPA: hypothetical protein ACTUT5_003788 [Legionella anisa]|uniref:Secreted protein n=1 Tax=Legionella anisa TaxID=28082 RepID=A0AAX0WT94_9GAMM|nr:hypothetical protein [Legionella anisa]AWN73171.1 hypothetical protein DLD14_04565 [Legionella anisa]MBN5937627.1 hypothetical protein [Legionella anisa]MCW8424003.1 hypothetical protein [Legionella anisa]MCW8447525.1 hypothetical protein [Legionella anisa]PNL60289.1 hypothetical protein A6J39_003155 [Legionella anisa]